MERTVTVKKWYVVTGTAGATVTSPDGSKIFCTVPDGGQGTFYATTPKVVTSDDSVEVVEATFNLAPVKLKLLGLLGGGVSTGLPSGYLAAEFLESTGEQYIDSNFVPTQETAVRSVAQFTYTGAVFAGLQSRYSSGVSFIDASGTVYWRFFGISGTWKRDYTKNEIVLSKKGLVINGEQQEQSGTLGSYNVPSIAIFASKWASDGSYNNNGNVRLFELEIRENNETILSLVPVIDAQGVPCLFDTVSEQPFYNSGSGAFIVGFETVEAARRLARLPKVAAGELTVSLPAAARDAASMVPAALSIAASRGWTIIEQYRD